MNRDNFSRKIGIFYDGNFLLHASNYYNYIHSQKRRLSLCGLHNFVRHRVAEEEGVDPRRCSLVEAHYFRGRLNAAEASQRGNQLYNDRVFDDILMSEGVQTHYLPLRNIFGRKEERGIDVWLSLEVLELTIFRGIDVVVLIVSDTDYVPLVRKLNSLGVRVMLLSWEFEYTNDEGNKVITKTSHELIQLANYPISMHEVIDCGLDQDNPLVTSMFVNTESRCEGEKEVEINHLDTDHTEIGDILSLKNGYGFIKYPNNNLFFHSMDVIGDFTTMTVGDTVEFTIEKNSSGQDVAKNVRRFGDPMPESSEPAIDWNSSIFEDDKQ